MVHSRQLDHAPCVAACRPGSPNEGEVRGVVINADRAMEEAFSSKGDIAAVEQYFATPEEGADPGGLANTRDALWKAFGDHPRASALIEFSNFRIADVQVHSSSGLAKVTYQIDVRMVHSGNVGTATVTQDLALLKTKTRGWRISGGDAPQVSNVVGQFP